MGAGPKASRTWSSSLWTRGTSLMFGGKGKGLHADEAISICLLRSIDFLLYSILYIIFLGNSLGYSAPPFLLLTPSKIYSFFLEWTEDSGQLDTLFFLFNIPIEDICTINALLNQNPVIIQAELTV